MTSLFTLPSGRRWQVVPQLLLRRAGFPFQEMTALASPETATLARQFRAQQALLAALKQRLLRREFHPAVQYVARQSKRQLLRWMSEQRRRVGRDRSLQPFPGTSAWMEARRVSGLDRSIHPDFQGPFEPTSPLSTLLSSLHEWETQLQALDISRQRLGEQVEVEYQAACLALWAFFARPEIREALFLLVPNLVETVEHKLDRPPTFPLSAQDRLLARRLYAFAQRLVAKNETTSYFGPMTYGEISEQVEVFDGGPEARGGILKREVFAAFWAVTELSRVISRDPEIRATLPLRRIPAVSLWPVRSGEPSAADAHAGRSVGTGAADQQTEMELRNAEGQPVGVSADGRRMFMALDEARSIPALAEFLGLPLGETETLARQLERLGLARRTLEPFSTTSSPQQGLRLALPNNAAGARWRKILDQLDEQLEQFAVSALPERKRLQKSIDAWFEQLSGKEARRGQGQMYADRTVFYEECQGDQTPFRFPAQEARRLEQVIAPALELGATYGGLRQQAVKALALQVLREKGDVLPGDSTPCMPFLRFAEALDRAVEQGALLPLQAPAREWLARFSALVAQASDGRVARLTSAQLAPFLASSAGVLFASPDVMLAAQPDGRLLYVIGEVHPYVFGWGSQGHFAPDPAALQAALSADLRPWGGKERIATVLRRRRHKGLVTAAFPGRFIEVTGRAVDDPQRCLAIGALTVKEGREGAELWAPDGPLTLYTGEDDHVHLQAFAPVQTVMPPIRLQGHTPRIELGSLVLQRERWSFEEGTLTSLLRAQSPEALALAVMQFQQEHDLPRYGFVSSRHEPKPICMDLESPFAQEWLRHLLTLGPITFSEMLPGPETLWLQRSAGAFTSEFRLAMTGEA